MGADRFLLSLGDCNTLGTLETEKYAYPLLLARKLGVEAVNCGHTMGTIREGWQYARRRLTSNTGYLTIQYGLVDSWLTFRGAPHVLYYPDNFGRLVLRKLAKKYKKLGRKLGFHRLFGEKHYVSTDEYRRRFEAIIRLARERSPAIRICLISTSPSRQEHRNSGIEKFNQVLQQVAQANRCAFVDAYAPFVGKPEMLEDYIHLKPEAHEIVAELCLAALRPQAPEI